MEYTTTLTLGLIAAFLASVAGIGFVYLSRNVQAKRVALPIALLVFSGLWFEIFRRATDSSAVMLALVAAVLLANAIWFARRISYCSVCGRTVQDQSGGTPPKCAQCSDAE